MKTNTDMLNDLMDFSRHGALMQAFVIEAILRYADQCIEAGAATFDSPFMNGHAWVGCAIEARDAIKAHLARDPADLELEEAP